MNKVSTASILLIFFKKGFISILKYVYVGLSVWGYVYLSAGTCRVQRCPIPGSWSHRWLWALRIECWELNWSSSSATVICTLNCWAISSTLLLFLKVTFIFIDGRFFFSLHFNSITKRLYYVAQIGLKFIIFLSLCPPPKCSDDKYVPLHLPVEYIFITLLSFYSLWNLIIMKSQNITILKHLLFENTHNTVYPLYKNLNY